MNYIKMTGGLLQLVAKGYDDLYITETPEITFFKTVYRRYSNFSKVHRYINRNHEMSFGSSYTCYIKRFGDLLHRMYLEIDLPTINMHFPVLTKSSVKKSLYDFDITWDYTGNPEDAVTLNEYTNEILPLIQTKEADLDVKNVILDLYMSVLYNYKDYESGTTYSSQDILNLFLNDIITGSPYELQFRYFYAYSLDDSNLLPSLPTDFYRKPKSSDKIQVLMYQELVNYIFQRFDDKIISNSVEYPNPQDDYIYLNINESNIDNYYTIAVSGYDWYIKLDNQVRKILSYDGSTHKATITNWTTTPTTFKYNLYNHTLGGYFSYVYPRNYNGPFYVTLDTIASNIEHYYDNWIIRYGSTLSRILYHNPSNNKTLIEIVREIPLVGQQYTLYNEPVIYYASGTIGATTTNSVVLNGSNLSTSDDYYAGWFLKFSDLTPYIFQIIRYEGATKTAFVNEFYFGVPTGTYKLFMNIFPEYTHSVIAPGDGSISFGLNLYGSVINATINTITFDADAPSNQYALGTDFDVSVGQSGSKISKYNYETKTATLENPWGVIPKVNDTYLILYHSPGYFPPLGFLTAEGVLTSETFVEFQTKERSIYDAFGNLIKANQNLYSNLMIASYKGFMFYYNPSITSKINIEPIDTYINRSSFIKPHSLSNGLNCYPLKKTAFYSTSLAIQNDEDYLYDYSAELNFLVYHFIKTFDFNTVPLYYIGLELKTYVINTIKNQIENWKDGFSYVFKFLDSYHVIDNYISGDVNYTITSRSIDLSDLMEILSNQIYWNIYKNQLQLQNIFNNIKLNVITDPHFRIMNYKFCPSGSFNTNPFVLASNLNLNLNDNFTSSFNVAVDPSEPDYINHYYGTYVSSYVNDFTSSITNYMNLSNYENYFNFSTLWTRSDFDYYVSFDSSDVSLKKVCVLNTVPYIVCSDIPSITTSNLQNYLKYYYPSLDVSILLTTYQNTLTLFGTTLQASIKDDLKLSTSDLTYLIEINTYNGKTDSDYMIYFVFRPEKTYTLSSNTYYPLEYVIRSFQETSNTFFNDSALQSSYPSITDWTSIKTICNDVMESFMSSTIPDYSSYVKNKYRIQKDIYDSSSTQGTIYSDASSSLFNVIFNNTVFNYNKLYAYYLLDYTYLSDYIGTQSLITRNISCNILNLDLNMFFNYNVYAFTLTSNFSLGETTEYEMVNTFINYRLQCINNLNNNYNYQYKLLNINKILIDRPLNFFNTKDNICSTLNDVITSNKDLYYPYLYNSYYYDIDLVNNYLDNICQKFLYSGFGISDRISGGSGSRGSNLDVFYEFRNNVAFIEPDVNPYSLDPSGTENARYLWYQTFILNKTEIEKNNFITVFNTLMNNISNSSFYKDTTNIFSKFDTFYQKKNMDMYFFSYIIKNFLTYGDIFDYLDPIWTITYVNLMNYYNSTKSSNTTMKNNIEVYKSYLLNSVSRTTPNFAWIHYLGFFLIDKISLEIDGQIINQHTGEWLYLNYFMNEQHEQQSGIQKMIGEITDLTTFNTTTKQSKKLYIPLLFWFCKTAGWSLPLVSLQFSKIKINLKLKSINQIAYWDTDAEFTKVPKVSCSFVGEFFYLENEERQFFSKNKLEYLIEDVRYNGDFFYMSNNLDKNNYIRQYINFKNSCKEIIFFAQPTNNTDGSLTNGELKPYKFNFTYSKTNGTQSKITQYVKHYDGTLVALDKKISFIHNFNDPPLDDFPIVFEYSTENITKTFNLCPIVSSKIKFNGNEREIEFNEPFYQGLSIIRHNSSTPDGVLNYSFSLKPNSEQPSGSANFGQIEEIAIHIKINDTVITEMSNFQVRFGIYCNMINILRIMSGLAGLAFE